MLRRRLFWLLCVGLPLCCPSPLPQHDRPLPLNVSDSHAKSPSEEADLGHGQQSGHDGAHSHPEHDHDAEIHVASWRYGYVKVPLILSGFIIVIVIVKILFHHLHAVAEVIPESCMLILLGLLLGTLFLAADPQELAFLRFDPDFFFLCLLPPIILEAAYSLKDRAFVENIGTILLYAVVGTILNTVIIAAGLYALKVIGALGSLDVGPLDCLIFSSLIAAVDPVAVLAIFEEVGVNKMLYYMVFGESLFNDAVTVVLYNLMVTFKKMANIEARDIGLGVASFLCSSFGALGIGFIFGLLSALITKYTSKLRVVEPIVMFGMAYLSYLVAELFHFSGIISIICCGLNQCQYAAENISSKSYITVHYFSKVAASVTESMIFIILGVMLVQDRSIWASWSTAFSLYSLALCLIARFAVVFFLTFLVNDVLQGVRRISTPEQCIMAYGGLRGAVCFSLVFMLNDREVPVKDTLMTATLLVILFTVFVQGITIKPMVRILRIKLQTVDTNLFKEINRGVQENFMAGVEEIIGHYGTHTWKALTQYLSQKFLRPAIQKHPRQRGQGLVAAYQESKLQSEIKRYPSTASSIPDSETLWHELETLEGSSLAGSQSMSLLTAHDENRTSVKRRPAERQESTPSVNFQSPHHLLELRDMLSKPLYKTVVAMIFPRVLGFLFLSVNLRRDYDQHHKEVEHMAKWRKVLRRHGKKPSVMRAALFPAIPSFAVLTPLHEVSPDEELISRLPHDETQETNLSEVPPTFTLEVPAVVERRPPDDRITPADETDGLLD